MRWHARTIVQRNAARRASRPQLKRDPLGTDSLQAMTTTKSHGTLPAEAEQFLARLPTLSSAAWADIIARDREPVFPTLQRLVRGLKLMITPHRFRRGFDAVYSKVADDRLRQLAETGALPRQYGWRMIHAAGTALQALCCRSALLDHQIIQMYAPFEPHIPVASLRSPRRGESSSGRAGA